MLETKGVSGQIQIDGLGTQGQKIRCGERHFEALESGVEFCGPVKIWSEVKRGA